MLDAGGQKVKVRNQSAVKLSTQKVGVEKQKNKNSNVSERQEQISDIKIRKSYGKS